MASWTYIDKLCSPYAGFGNLSVSIIGNDTQPTVFQNLGIYTIIEGVGSK